jgi:hypothetical protein
LDSWQACEDVEAEVRRRLGMARPHAVVLLSPRVWGVVGAAVREDRRVLQIEFQVHPSAWPAIADAIGLPLGAAG